MPTNVIPIIRLKDMDLVRSLIAALTQITPAHNSKLAKVFIAHIGKLLRDRIYFRKTPDHRHNINDRFSRQSGNRCASNMIKCHAILCENGLN